MPSQTRILDFSGTAAFLRKLRQIRGAGQQAAKAALYQEAEQIMTTSKKRCPVDVGNLRNSASVQPPKIEQGHIVVVMGYGGPVGIGNQGETNDKAVNYAIIQHEDLSLNHSKMLSKKESARRGGVIWGEIGGPKYLEKPVLAAERGMEARLRARIKKGLEDAAR